MGSQIKRLQRSMDLIHKRVNTEMLELLPPEITQPQMIMMYHLFKLGLCKLSQLADRLHVKPSSITVMIDRLEKVGFVKRSADANDRRIVLVQLTEEGIDMIHKMVDLRGQSLARLFEDITDEQLEAVVEIFEKVTEPYSDLL